MIILFCNFIYINLYTFITYFIKYILTFAHFFCIEFFFGNFKESKNIPGVSLTLYRILFLERASYSKNYGEISGMKQTSWMIKITMTTVSFLTFNLNPCSIVARTKEIYSFK